MSNSKPEKTYAVGWVKDAHGLKGELYIQLFAKGADWLESFEEFWLKTGDAYSHFEVERAKPHRDGLIVKSPKILDRTQAEGLRKSEFLISEDLLRAAPGETIFLKQILGFKVFNGDTEWGPITGFSSNGAQDLLNVDKNGKEVLIPFVEAFVKNIDFDKGVVQMELPEGLEDNE